jgi:acetyl-CoA carboxylase biotin carboxyl carrier protein
VNLKEIKEMINLMNDNNLCELEIEREGMKVRIKKQEKPKESPQAAIKQEYIVEQTSQSSTQSTDRQQVATANTVEIKSPMVGTFYRAPAPEAAPFVEIGQNVEVGQVVCIIEAMKLMNEIKAEIKGKIKEVLVENGDPVEFGQPLFVVELS